MYILQSSPPITRTFLFTHVLFHSFTQLFIDFFKLNARILEYCVLQVKGEVLELGQVSGGLGAPQRLITGAEFIDESLLVVAQDYHERAAEKEVNEEDESGAGEVSHCTFIFSPRCARAHQCQQYPNTPRQYRKDQKVGIKTQLSFVLIFFLEGRSTVVEADANIEQQGA